MRQQIHGYARVFFYPLRNPHLVISQSDIVSDPVPFLMMHSSLFIFTLFTALATAEPKNNTYFRHVIRTGQHFSHPPDLHPNKSTALSKVPSQKVSPGVEGLFSICMEPVFTVTATVTTFCDPKTHSTPFHGEGTAQTAFSLKTTS